MQKLLSLISPIYSFFKNFIILGGESKKILQQIMPKSILLMFSSKSLVE